MPANLTPLVADLNSDNRAHRVRAAEEFSRLGSEAAPAAVALVEACGDESEEVREYVMAALEELGPPGREAIEPLVALLPHPTADTGYWAATLLGRLERHAAPAVPALVAALNGAEHASVRQRAAWALGQIGPSAAPAVESLTRAATARDPRLARLAQRAIKQIGG